MRRVSGWSGWKSLAGGGLMVIFVAGAMVMAANEPWQEDNAQHPFNDDCMSCHLSDPEASPVLAKRLIGSQESLCAECHKAALRSSHPSGFRPGKELPAEFPVDWKGDLTCSTCHNIHFVGVGLTATDGQLRVRKSQRDFCLSCHELSFFEKMADKGSSLTGSGHLFARLTTQGILDAATQQCLGCHEDTVDSRPGRIIVRHSEGAVAHPLGVIYSEAEARGTVKQGAKLNPKVTLVDDRVGCTSCHTSYSGDHGKLVIGKTGTSLCRECH